MYRHCKMQLFLFPHQKKTTQHRFENSHPKKTLHRLLWNVKLSVAMHPTDITWTEVGRSFLSTHAENITSLFLPRQHRYAYRQCFLHGHPALRQNQESTLETKPHVWSRGGEPSHQRRKQQYSHTEGFVGWGDGAISWEQ